MQGDISKHFRIGSAVIFVIVCVFLLFPTLTEARRGTTLTGRVMQVKDGDTVTISPEDGGPFFICRLYGIDAPETAHLRFGKGGQRYGEEASKELKRLILGMTVEVTTSGQTTYKREVCIIKKDGTDINLEMVKRGYAWAYRQYLRRPYASDYIAAELEARENHRGLWGDRAPTPPWEFRRMMQGK